MELTLKNIFAQKFALQELSSWLATSRHYYLKVQEAPTGLSMIGFTWLIKTNALSTRIHILQLVSPNVLLWISLPLTLIRLYPGSYQETFKSDGQSGNFRIRKQFGYVWTLNLIFKLYPRNNSIGLLPTRLSLVCCLDFFAV